MQSYGYLNNNNTILTTTNTNTATNANNNNNNSSGNNQATLNPHTGTTSAQTTQSILINALAGGPSILERGDYMQCKHCKRFYKSVQKLQEHVRKYCLKEKKYKCVSCEYRSRRKDHVLRHARRKHSDLYEQYRDDEENLFVIRTEEEGSYEADVDYEGPNEDYLIPAVSMGIGSSGGSMGFEGHSSSVGIPSAAASTMQSMGFKFGSRDLIITAVPVLQESEEDDDDYDEDGEFLLH
ncbi:kinesin-related protein 6-like [Lucilia sericata]|uniref:kinesin-related protein 6-like n=1 Tax=Lucilia sericata TaxID=13632 RepID=UPI0018A87E5E|nr:kinesin-related protein 6-like [Lucilia sericata]